jgi:ABC-2 type transport system permease protein
MGRAIRHIVRKEFIQLFRDRRMLIPIFLAPVIQLILFGYAANLEIKHVAIAAVDLGRTSDSRALISAFQESGYFDVTLSPSSPKEVDAPLQTGKIQAALIIGEDFGRRIGRGERAPFQVIIDGTDANSATIIQNYVALIAAKFGTDLIARAGVFKEGALNFLEPRVWYNPELKSSAWMVPGVFTLILLLTTLILTSMAITREREMGTLEQLIVSPIRPVELILGKTIPFVIIGLCDIFVVLAAAKVVFNVPVRGSFAFLIGSSLIFILTTLSLGLLISTVSRTQGQAMMLAMFFMMPAMLLSSVFSSIENMPRIIQYLTYLNPLRYFSEIVRGTLLKGIGLRILWPNVAALLVFGVVTIVVSSFRFKKYLE